MLNGLMLQTVFLKTLRDLRRPLLGWAAGLGLICLWMVTLFPTVAQASGFAELLENMPDSLRALIGEASTLETVEGYLSIELFNFFLPALTIAFAVSFGSSLISHQEESGALDLLLSNPVPRWRVFLAKFGALVAFTLIVLATCYVGMLIGGAMVDVALDAGRLLEGILTIFAITLFFGALALSLTGVKGSQGLAVGVSAGLAVITYFLYTLQPITDLPGWVRDISPWTYYAGDTVLIEGINWGYFALLVGLAVAFVAIGMVVFERRDLGT